MTALYNSGMAPDKKNSGFSIQAYRIQMLLAKRKDVPIAPPVRPVFLNPTPLTMLGQLQFHHADDSYRRLLRSEGEEPPPFLFAHPL